MMERSNIKYQILEISNKKAKIVIYVVCVFTFCLLLFTFSKPAFAPVLEGTDPQEVLRVIEIQREEAKKANEIEINNAVEKIEKTEPQVSVRPVEEKQGKDNQKFKFWLITLGIIALGIFILTRIKSDKK